MRDIKFRGMRENSEWATGYYALFPATNSHIIIEPFKSGSGSVHEYEVNPETIGQYTGLKDKNGVEIYEGDVIQTKFLICAIKFRNGCFYPFNSGLTPFSMLAEVIGNIHENPELLEVKK